MFRIGEFSKIAQVSASLLRYYDDIGLFVPIHSDRDTGYRYYSVEQLSQLNRILALKDLGLALDQIKRLIVDEVSPEEIRGMFSLRKAQIEQTLQVEAARLRAVESRLQQLEREEDFQDDDVVLKSLPAQSFLSCRCHFQGLDQVLAVINQMTKAVTQQVAAKALERFAAVIHSELYEDQDWDLEFGFYLNQVLDLTVPLSDGMVMGVRELEPVEMAVTAVRYGGPENGHLCYSAIGTWAEKHQYELIGPSQFFSSYCFLAEL
ncbi:MAG: MerR family transcriptional regulator [Leptolyngbya sp. SIO3F4]|nr:MerR family transcriptional regulator [Leptolyngbya sp. SIO3F4]